jgi:hypothetical protein
MSGSGKRSRFSEITVFDGITHRAISKLGRFSTRRPAPGRAHITHAPATATKARDAQTTAT